MSFRIRECIFRHKANRHDRRIRVFCRGSNSRNATNAIKPFRFALILAALGSSLAPNSCFFCSILLTTITIFFFLSVTRLHSHLFFSISQRHTFDIGFTGSNWLHVYSLKNFWFFFLFFERIYKPNDVTPNPFACTMNVERRFKYFLGGEIWLALNRFGWGAIFTLYHSTSVSRRFMIDSRGKWIKKAMSASPNVDQFVCS